MGNSKENINPALYDPYNRERLLTATHEAGHAVACWFHGGKLLSLALSGNGEGQCKDVHRGLNYLRFSDIDHPEVRDGVLCSLAGCAAQARMQLQLSNRGLAPDGYFWDTAGARADCIRAMARLHLMDADCGVIKLTVEEFYERFGAEARTWVWHERGVWEGITALAEALLQAPTRRDEFGFSGPRIMSGREAVGIILENWTGELPGKALPLERHANNAQGKEIA